MKTCFRAIRSSSQEIAIFAKRPIGCTDSVNRLESLLGWLVATAEEDGLNIRRKASLRKAAERTIPRLRRRIARFACTLAAREACNYFRHAGYK
jgi:hypothetical protein